MYIIVYIYAVHINIRPIINVYLKNYYNQTSFAGIEIRVQQTNIQ